MPFAGTASAGSAMARLARTGPGSVPRAAAKISFAPMLKHSKCFECVLEMPAEVLVARNDEISGCNAYAEYVKSQDNSYASVPW